MKKKAVKLMAGLACMLFFSVSAAGCLSSDTGSDKNNVKEETYTDSADAAEEIKKSPEEIEKEKEEKFLNDWLENHTLEEKIAQMFVVTPEVLAAEETVTSVNESFKENISQYPVGGIIFFGKNLENPEQTKNMLQDMKNSFEEKNIITPFLAVDEEGGSVARVGNNPAFNVRTYSSMSEIGNTNDPAQAKAAAEVIGDYLSELGFNMDMAPDADVLSNPSNTVIGNRSFGSNPQMVADMVLAQCEGFKEKGITPIVKHFPGHGDTSQDSHEGYASTNKTLDELRECEFIPFKNAAENNVEVIMAGHISLPGVFSDNLPASLSENIITGLLRKELNYDGVVITDALNMGAVSNTYSSKDAAILAVNAGADILLMPQNFSEAYNGLIESVKNGGISEERINESVKRILKVKYKK